MFNNNNDNNNNAIVVDSYIPYYPKQKNCLHHTLLIGKYERRSQQLKERKIKMTSSNKSSTVWLKDFKELEIPDLIFNIWSYNTNKEHLTECGICNLGNKYAIMALRGKWEDELGDFEYILSKWKQNDKQYMNVGRYSEANKYEMIDFIKKYNKKN